MPGCGMRRMHDLYFSRETAEFGKFTAMRGVILFQDEENERLRRPRCGVRAGAFINRVERRRIAPCGVI